MINMDEINRINEIITKINNDATVIVGPKCGSIEKRDNKLRIYSHGGNIMNLATTPKAKNKIFPDKKYEERSQKLNKELKTASVNYNEIKEDTIKKAIEVACYKKGENNDDSEAQERAIETKIIKINRAKQNSKSIIIDMEFCSPTAWLTTQYPPKTNENSTRGRVDLVVYDKEYKSFGIIELKSNNKSCDNLEKHFSDYYIIANSKFSRDIKLEFCRKIKYLMHYKFIEKISDIDLEKAIEQPIWKAFLFIDGNSSQSKKLFDEAKIDKEIIDRKKFGFQYSKTPEEVDLSKSKFFEYLCQNQSV